RTGICGDVDFVHSSPRLPTSPRPATKTRGHGDAGKDADGRLFLFTPRSNTLDGMNSPANTLLTRCMARRLGTFILVLFGWGAVHAAVLAGAQSGLWQVAVVWGIGVMLAIFVVGGVSGAHINPAITVSLSTWGRFPKSEVLPYILAQMVGGF